MIYFDQNAIISGLGLSRIGRRTGIPGAERTLEAARAAIEDAGLTASDIDDVGGAGHMVAGDRNDHFAGAVVEFLARHEQNR
jgi:hypothetical protein